MKIGSTISEICPGQIWFHWTWIFSWVAEKSAKPHDNIIIIQSRHLSSMVSQITRTSTVCLAVCTGQKQRKRQNSALLTLTVGNPLVISTKIHSCVSIWRRQELITPLILYENPWHKIKLIPVVISGMSHKGPVMCDFGVFVWCLPEHAAAQTVELFIWDPAALPWRHYTAFTYIYIYIYIYRWW